MTRSRDRGNIILLVLILSIIMFLAISTLFTMVSEEGAQTGNLVKELHATYVGEAVANHIVSLVNRSPWEERFYLKQAKLVFMDSSSATPEPIWTFDHSTFPFDGSGATAWGKHVEYVGTVKDLDAFRRTYRMYLEVSYFNHKVTLSCDKRYEEDFVGALNNECTDLNKLLEIEITEQAKGDDRLEKIKEEAESADKVANPEVAKELERIKKDTDEYSRRVGLNPDLMPDTTKVQP